MNTEPWKRSPLELGRAINSGLSDLVTDGMAETRYRYGETCTGGFEMTANVGSLDRIARLLLGVGLIVLATFGGLPVFDAPTIKYGAVAVGLVLAGTAAFRFCPLYRLLGIKTCRV